MNSEFLKLFNSSININEFLKLEEYINKINLNNNLNVSLYKKFFNLNEIFNFLIINNETPNYYKIKKYLENLNLTDVGLIKIVNSKIKYILCVGLLNNKLYVFGYTWSFENNNCISQIHCLLNTLNSQYNIEIINLNNNFNLDFLYSNYFVIPNLIN